MSKVSFSLIFVAVFAAITIIGSAAIFSNFVGIVDLRFDTTGASIRVAKGAEAFKDKAVSAGISL